MMTKKNFEAIAAALMEQRPPWGATAIRHAAYVQWLGDVQAIARICKASNPAFNMSRFLSAAGVE